jgi:hypothetical protein
MIHKSTLVKATVMVALLACATFWTMDRAGAFTLIERAILFPDLGITREQTARINVTNLGDTSLNFSWSVFDNNNVNHLPPTVLTLEPGQTGYADLKADAIGFFEGRQQIRPVIKFVDNPDLRKRGSILSSVEVFDNDTLKTRVVILPAVQ